MFIASVVLYHITRKEDIPGIEAAIRADDEEAFQEHGPYFQYHKGHDYLLSEGDIGYHSDARDYLLERYDPQGGLEISAQGKELQELRCLLTSEDCYSCSLGNRLLLLPKHDTFQVLVEWMCKRAGVSHVTSREAVRKADHEHGREQNACRKTR